MTNPDTAEQVLAEALLTEIHIDWEHGFGEFTTAPSLAAELLAASPQLKAALELGLAWQRAEAALPEGRELRLSFLSDDPFEPFEEGDEQYAASSSNGPNKTWNYCEGPTPAAALEDLTAALNEAKSKEGK